MKLTIRFAPMAAGVALMKEREMKRFALSSSTFVMALLVALMFTSCARADTYYLNQSGISGVSSSNFGTVTLSDVTGGVYVYVKLSSGNFFAGPGNEFMLNVSNVSNTYGNDVFYGIFKTGFVASPTDTLGAIYTSSPGPGQGLGDLASGYFDAGASIPYLRGTSATYNELYFTVSGVSISDLVNTSFNTTTGNQTSFFGAQIGVGGGATGLVWSGGPAPCPTPEPSSLLLFGVGLLTLGVLYKGRSLIQSA